MHYVYVLISLKKKWIYIGCTDNLKRRFKEHNLGLVISTKAHKPFKLICYEAYLSKTDAFTREYRLKNHSQTRELLYKQLARSINKALSSNG
ncbi:MAG: GIY-YIG nuclease family protein [Candidatus Doudnabacteria bacterium]